MIEVFKTNIQEQQIANNIVRQLLKHYPEGKINFDLEDCDKILRIEYVTIDIPKVIKLLNENEFQCEVLV
ncbi:hypothetical protein NTJ28_002394 [Flavobacterium psychrophilum]|nr:hypothetical protein [Flavobacterium psychrophilum]EKT4510695.1 hypothetical protein [Flavobacterium psychrophilum]